MICPKRRGDWEGISQNPNLKLRISKWGGGLFSRILAKNFTFGTKMDIFIKICVFLVCANIALLGNKFEHGYKKVKNIYDFFRKIPNPYL